MRNNVCKFDLIQTGFEFGNKFFVKLIGGWRFKQVMKFQPLICFHLSFADYLETFQEQQSIGAKAYEIKRNKGFQKFIDNPYFLLNRDPKSWYSAERVVLVETFSSI